MMTVDEAMRFAGQQYTKQSFAGVMAAEVLRLQSEMEAHKAALQNLMSFLSVNGCWEWVDADDAEKRIRDGIDMLVRPAVDRAERAERELKEVKEWLIQSAKNPSPYILGNQYTTQSGELVRFVSIHNEGRNHETMADEHGVHRYTRRDFGRVTGSCHEYSHPLNTPPLYANPVPAAVAVPAVPDDKALIDLVYKHFYTEKDRSCLLRDVGPYEVTEPRPALRDFARALLQSTEPKK